MVHLAPFPPCVDAPASWCDIRLVVGRIRPSESLFYYDVANGRDYDYYNDTSDYTPQFDIQPTEAQEEAARRVCTVNGVVNQACAYDLYATGNEEASAVSASVNSEYGTAQNTLG